MYDGSAWDGETGVADSWEYPSELIDRPEHPEQSVKSYVKVTAEPPGGRDQLLKKVVAVRTAK
jgi:hypothetical protein